MGEYYAHLDPHFFFGGLQMRKYQCRYDLNSDPNAPTSEADLNIAIPSY